MAIPEVEKILSQIKDIHEKKNSDYASEGKHFENFERASLVSSWFSNPEHHAFTVLIGTKLARLAVLLNTKKEPNNESIDDSFLDLCTYCILWWGFYKRSNQKLAFIALDQAKTVTVKDNIWVSSEKYQCKQCGARFSYAPHIAGIAHPLEQNILYYFDSSTCIKEFLKANPAYFQISSPFSS